MSPGLFGPTSRLRSSSVPTFLSLHSAPASQPPSALPACAAEGLPQTVDVMGGNEMPEGVMGLAKASGWGERVNEVPRGWEASSLEGSPRGGGEGFLHPLPASGNDKGGGGCSPQPRGGCPGLPLCRCTSPPRPAPWVQALSASVPSPVGGAVLLLSWRLQETISESGYWRSPGSVPRRGLWAARSQGGPRGLSQTAVSSRAGWGRRAEWPMGGWSVGSHNQAPELAVVQLAADAECVPSSSWGHCCAHGAGVVCARVPALWPGCARAPGSSWSKRQQLNFCQCACVWCPQHPPLIYPSEARLDLCWVLGTCDGWMWSPLSRSPCFVWEAVCAGH